MKRMPPKYGSSVLSRVKYALPPLIDEEKNGDKREEEKNGG